MPEYADELEDASDTAARPAQAARSHTTAECKMSHILEYEGYCPICENRATYRAKSGWFRDSLVCQNCVNGSVPRERALALVLNETIPNWRELSIHECSPVSRGISYKLRREASGYTPTQYFPGEPLGQFVRNVRNEDLQSLTFEDESFDAFISLDVMEHIPNPEAAFKEIWRHLKIGGVMVSTWPVRKHQTEAMERRAIFNPDGTITHIKEPEIHGNPVSAEGALVTVDYGYNVHQLISQWAPFDVRVYRFSDRTHGLLGEYTEVFTCRKRAS